MLRIETLNQTHKRKSFDCGNKLLNQYLQKMARQHAVKGVARTFVLIDDLYGSDILGFFTLSVCELHAEELPNPYAKKYPRLVPAAKLARLAVHKAQQRQGLGNLMMTEAMQRVINVSEQVGIIGFLVDAKDEAAKRYYQRYGFLEFPKQALKLFLPMDTLKSAFERTKRQDI